MKGKYAEYHNNYAKEKLKRIPLDVKLDEYETIKDAAEIAGEPIITFIKNAIRKRIEQMQKLTGKGEE